MDDQMPPPETWAILFTSLGGHTWVSYQDVLTSEAQCKVVTDIMHKMGFDTYCYAYSKEVHGKGKVIKS